MAPEVLRALLARAGFRERAWEDVSAAALAAMRAIAAAPRIRGAAVPAGVQVIHGAEAPTMSANMAQGQATDRLRTAQAVFARGSDAAGRASDA